MFKRNTLPPLLLLSLMACGAPARRMPARIVDDPMSLPKRMARASVSTRTETGAVKGVPATDVRASFTYAITNRLELADVFSLRYTFADDAPTFDGSAPSKISFAVRAGLGGLGYSSVEGGVFLPLLQLQLRKRISPDAYVFATTTGVGRVATDNPWHSYLFSQDAGILTQISGQWAWHSSVGFSNERLCRDGCTWQPPWVRLGTGLSMRPAHWIEFGPSLTINHRLRAPVQDPLPLAPDSPVLQQQTARSVWFTGVLYATFYW